MSKWIDANKALKKYDLTIDQLFRAIKSGLVAWEPTDVGKAVLVSRKDVRENPNQIKKFPEVDPSL